jgi:flagellar biosynthesis protein
MRVNMENNTAEKRAIAIRYDPEHDNSPVILAAGKGLVAEKIMANADANNIPVYEDEFQANALSTLDVGSRIPSFLYDLVAEILLFVEEMDY